MTFPTIARGAAAAVLAALVAGCQSPEPESDRFEEAAPAVATQASDASGFLYGRVTTYGGDVYEGRLRWGGGEEAFWNDTFNGVKDENPWAALPPVQRLAEARRPARVFGFRVPWGEPEIDLSRPFMARFGDIARIESRGGGVQGVVEQGTEFDPDVRVTLKSGAVFDLDRLSASDFDDGVRVWDEARGVVDLGPRRIRTVELSATAPLRGAPDRLYGTVRTRGGRFTGPLQWDRQFAVGSDEWTGRTEAGEVRLRFDAIRTIARQRGGGAVLALRGGRQLAVSGGELGRRGVYVHDPRYGRVLVSWDAFERADFMWDAPGSGPAYGDFAAGRPLTGTATTRAGRRLTGRLVYDLDESETTETLDAPAAGVDYSIPFGQIASVVLAEDAASRDGALATVTLRSGEVLELGRAGDLGEGNAGVLVFPSGQQRPEYLPWTEVARVDLDAAGGRPSS